MLLLLLLPRVLFLDDLVKLESEDSEHVLEVEGCNFLLCDRLLPHDLLVAASQSLVNVCELRLKVLTCRHMLVYVLVIDSLRALAKDHEWF